MPIEELIRRYEAGGGHLAKANAEGLAVPPALHTVVLTCMDSRIDVFALFGLQMGEVHVLRNAGGVVTDDVIRSLTISQRKLQTREILLMQHAGLRSRHVHRRGVLRGAGRRGRDAPAVAHPRLPRPERERAP